MKSIKQKIALSISLFLVGISIASLVIGIFCSHKSIEETVNDDLTSIGKITEMALENAMEKTKKLLGA